MLPGILECWSKRKNRVSRGKLSAYQGVSYLLIYLESALEAGLTWGSHAGTWVCVPFSLPVASLSSPDPCLRRGREGQGGEGSPSCFFEEQQLQQERAYLKWGCWSCGNQTWPDSLRSRKDASIPMMQLTGRNHSLPFQLSGWSLEANQEESEKSGKGFWSTFHITHHHWGPFVTILLNYKRGGFKIRSFEYWHFNLLI